MIEGNTREETIELTAAALGVSLIEAECIIAIELDEVTGDIIAVDDDGNEIPQPPAASV